MTATKLCLLTLCAAFVATEVIVTAAPAAAQSCEGDCNGDHAVTIDEIIFGVRIALAAAPIGDCRTMDGDGNGAVNVNELVAAATQALRGCEGAVAPTRTSTAGPTDTAMPPTSTSTPVPTNTAMPPTSTSTPVPTAVDEAALLASARVATDPIVRLFDLQASVADAAIVAGTARRTARGGSGGVSGCEQLDCALFGTLEVCCFETAFIQTFDTCTFDHGGGRSSVTGQYVIDSDAPGLCSGAIPLRASFVVVVDSFTHDLSFPDGSFSHTFQQLSESYEIAPDDCTVSEPDLFGFGIRGSGRRFINGALQRSRIDGSGHLLVDIESDADALQIAVGATEGPDGCSATATLNGALTAADFGVGTQFTTDFTDFHAIQHPQDGALFLGLNGTVGTDCLGDVTLSTGDPLRIARGDSCFTSGRLEAHVADGTVSGTYTGSGGLDLDFGADGSVDRHFATCADVPADRCSTNQVGLCAACTALSDCHRGLPCFSCSANCSGDTRRCAPATTFVTCEDGVF